MGSEVLLRFPAMDTKCNAMAHNESVTSTWLVTSQFIHVCHSDPLLHTHCPLNMATIYTTRDARESPLSAMQNGMENRVCITSTNLALKARHEHYMECHH